jgi:hypothetical protein
MLAAAIAAVIPALTANFLKLVFINPLIDNKVYLL